MLTQERVRELLAYDPDTGVFTWKVNTGTARAGDIAGYKRSDGYIKINVDGKKYYAHRLAWLYVHGYFPEHQIDHYNGIRDDNRICNLHEVVQKCQSQNCKVFSHNTSGFPGVYWHKQHQRWRAQIGINGKVKHLGYYPTALEAALARLTEEIWNPEWTCNLRGELVKSIKLAWPEFREVSRG